MSDGGADEGSGNGPDRPNHSADGAGRSPARSAQPTDVLIDDPSQRIEIKGDDDTVFSTRRVDLEGIQGSVIGDDAEEPAGEDEHDLAGRTLHGRYRLEHRLGSGGMGDVYVGRHLSLDMPVAVKVMHPHIAAVPEFARRFRREARAASLLHHRNVVQVVDFGADGKQLYLVMELLHGQSLGEWLLDFHEPPPLAEVTDIVAQLLDAFEAAHRLGIVHRDLKPDNIFLTEESDGRRVVKVVDFGLARIEDPTDQGPTLTKEDVVSGTPEYMSPEQCRSLSVGPSTDLYAIGCVLTDLLQLSPPFEGDNAMAILTRQMFWPAPALTRPPEAEPVPPLLEQLRLDLLAKSTEKRPADISAVRTRFEEATSPEATERRLPPRKDHEPTGSREDRVPEWTHAGTPTPRPGAAAAQQKVSLVHLDRSACGVTPDIGVGLAAHGILLREVSPDDAPESPIRVIDAGDDHDRAIALVERWASDRKARVLVCAGELDTPLMNRFIAAGVADVVTYPVDVDILFRKLKRLSRRRR